jgi:hypothetical protein
MLVQDIAVIAIREEAHDLAHVLNGLETGILASSNKRSDILCNGEVSKCYSAPLKKPRQRRRLFPTVPGQTPIRKSLLRGGGFFNVMNGRSRSCSPQHWPGGARPASGDGLLNFEQHSLNCLTPGRHGLRSDYCCLNRTGRRSPCCQKRRCSSRSHFHCRCRPA